jgi:ketosteroid isomerase-like protein
MKILIGFLILLAGSLMVFSQSNTDLENLVKTEKSFANTAFEKSVRQAFLEFLADDGVVFQPAAVNGKNFWQARPESPALLAWNPVWADISANGKIGYTTGDWDFRPKGKDDDPVAFGQYITIWKKQADGKFKAVLDIGTSHKKPEKVEKNWAFPKDLGKQENGQRTDFKAVSAFIKYSKYKKILAEDVRLYREEKLPFIGKKSALDEIQKEQANIKSGRISDEKCDGEADFKYCYGIMELTKKDKSVEKGNLMRIWKFRNSSWQILLEIYSPLPDK